MNVFTDHYNEWRMSRIKGLDKYLTDDFLNGKKVLELACGKADIGHILQQKGAIVIGCDARKEHLDVAKILYPSIQTFIWDGENDKIQDNYHVIVHWGLLYHLNKDILKTHLANVMDHCEYLLLESEVCDSNDFDILETREEGYDQAFHNHGSRPSESYVEKIILEKGFHYKKIKDSILNTNRHTYDWEITNTKQWQHGLRRFWICWKEESVCPIKEEFK